MNPITLNVERAYAITYIQFRLFPFRSPLLRESNSLSFPQGTEMVHFPWFASYHYVFMIGCLELLQDRLPHSGISGSKVAYTSPELIAVCHALLRQVLPRHPSYACLSLAI